MAALSLLVNVAGVLVFNGYANGPAHASGSSTDCFLSRSLQGSIVHEPSVTDLRARCRHP